MVVVEGSEVCLLGVRIKERRSKWPSLQDSDCPTSGPQVGPHLCVWGRWSDNGGDADVTLGLPSPILGRGGEQGSELSAMGSLFSSVVN